MKEFSTQPFQGNTEASLDIRENENQKILSENIVDNPENMDIKHYEQYFPQVTFKDGSILTIEHIMEGWKAVTKDLIINAQREKGTDDNYAVIFLDKDSQNDFSALSGKGMFNAKHQIEPFIRFIERETAGKWYASCDDRKRMRVYSRWLPKDKIIYE